MARGYKPRTSTSSQLVYNFIGFWGLQDLLSLPRRTVISVCFCDSVFYREYMSMSNSLVLHGGNCRNGIVSCTPLFWILILWTETLQLSSLQQRPVEHLCRIFGLYSHLKENGYVLFASSIFYVLQLNVCGWKPCKLRRFNNYNNFMVPTVLHVSCLARKC